MQYAINEYRGGFRLGVKSNMGVRAFSRTRGFVGRWGGGGGGGGIQSNSSVFDSKFHFHGKVLINLINLGHVFTLNIHTSYTLPSTSLQEVHLQPKSMCKNAG